MTGRRKSGKGPREREIVARHKTLFRGLGIKVLKTSGEGEPDLVGSLEGFAFAIECKQSGKKPTPLQEARLTEWRASGAIAFASDNPADSVFILEDEVDARKMAIWEKRPRKRYRGERRIFSNAPLYLKGESET